MSVYRVDKEALSALLFLCDGSSLAGTLYLAPQAPNHSGPQTVEDLMAEGGRVLPFRTTQDRFLLVGKATIAAIRIPTPAGNPEELKQRIRSRLRLAGPHSMEGDLLLDAGAGLRLSDAMNSSGPGILLESLAGLLWISKDHLVSIEAEDG